MILPIYHEIENIEMNMYLKQFSQRIFKLNYLDDFTLKDSFLNCSGFDLNKNNAYLKALGEAIERYTMNLYEIKENQELINFNEKFSNNFFSEVNLDYPLHALPMKNLKDDSIEYFPNEMINFKVTNSLEQYFPISSNGFAAHTNKFLAINNALLEVIERHIILKNWATLDPDNFKKINFDKTGINPIILNTIKKIEKDGWVFLPFLIIDSISIPTVLIWCHNPFKEKYYMGASCNENFNVSLENALLECLSKFNNNSLIDVNKSKDITCILERIYKSSEENTYRCFSSLDEIKETIDVYYKDFSLTENKEEYGYVVYKVIVKNLIYYWDKETCYLRKIKNRNKLFEKYGIFSLYSY